MDFLQINELVNIAQGRQQLIYDPPPTTSENRDVWALGICLFETLLTIESSKDGYDFLRKVKLAEVSESARMCLIKESIQHEGYRMVLARMLADKRPSATELLREPFFSCIKAIIEG